MFTSVQSVVVFGGKKTTPEERQMLRRAGFVHVTGLSVTPLSEAKSGYLIGEKLGEKDLGHWGQNNGIGVVVTTGGEVWLRAEMKDVEPEVVEVWKKFCPGGGGAFVPLSKAEIVSNQALLARVVDPDYGIVYKS